MDPTIREEIEKTIDWAISPKQIAALLRTLEKMRPLITYSDDVAFGYVLGFIFSLFKNMIAVEYNRQPTDEELQGYKKIIERRIPDIKRACMI